MVLALAKGSPFDGHVPITASRAGCDNACRHETEVFYGLAMSVARVHWAARLDGGGPWAPLWFGLSITILGESTRAE